MSKQFLKPLPTLSDSISSIKKASRKQGLKKTEQDRHKLGINWDMECYPEVMTWMGLWRGLGFELMPYRYCGFEDLFLSTLFWGCEDTLSLSFELNVTQGFLVFILVPLSVVMWGFRNI